MGLRERIVSCRSCGLRAGCRNPVGWSGPARSRVMVVGEAPGANEDLTGRPFSGAAGAELDRYLGLAGLKRSEVRVTNVVKCRPPDNRDPEEEEVETCDRWLLEELREAKPDIVVALGRFAGKKFLGEGFDADTFNGIPVSAKIPLVWEGLVVPIVHPAAGLHDPASMGKIATAFERLKDVLSGRLKPAIDDFEGKTVYGEIESASALRTMVTGRTDELIAFDTETGMDGKLWCVSVSVVPGSAVMFRKETEAWGEFLRMAQDPKYAWIAHNAPFDIKAVLEAAGEGVGKERKWFRNIHDTMQMAYVLQAEPMGLKSLARRWAGMKMRDYDEVMKATREERAKKAIREVFRKADVSSPEWRRVSKDFCVVLGDEIIREITETQKTKKSKKSLDARVAAALEKRRKDELARAVRDGSERGKAGVELRQNSASWVTGYSALERWKSANKPTREAMTKLLSFKSPEEVGLEDNLDIESTVEYSCRDADATLRLYFELKPKIEKEKLTKAYDLDRRILGAVVHMERAGMAADIETLESLRLRCAAEIAKADKAAAKWAGAEVNLASPKQVAELLYGKLKLKPPSGSKSTDKNALAALEGKHPVVEIIGTRRFYEKVDGDILASCMESARAAEDSRVRFELSVSRTETGRLASRNPNILGMPKRSEFGGFIRQAFVAPEGKKLLGLDYSQIELRMLAHESRDPAMVEAYVTGMDLHRVTVAKVFGVRYEDFDKKNPDHIAKRDLAKVVNFGIVYGMTAAGLKDRLKTLGSVKADGEDWMLADCEKFIEDWMTVAHPGAAKWLSNVAWAARRTGVVTNWAGRRRLVPQISSISAGAASAGRRQAYNMPIQSGAGDMMKAAMPKCLEAAGDCKAKMLLPFHDAFYFEVDDRNWKELAKVVKKIMETTVELIVPVVADVEVGKNWGLMKKVSLN